MTVRMTRRPAGSQRQHAGHPVFSDNGGCHCEVQLCAAYPLHSFCCSASDIWPPRSNSPAPGPTCHRPRPNRRMAGGGPPGVGSGGPTGLPAAPPPGLRELCGAFILARWPPFNCSSRCSCCSVPTSRRAMSGRGTRVDRRVSLGRSRRLQRQDSLGIHLADRLLQPNTVLCMSGCDSFQADLHATQHPQEYLGM